MWYVDLVIPAESNCIPGFVTREKQKKNLKNTTEHSRNPPAEFKLQVLRRCFENGESVKSVSEEIEYSRASIYMWRKRYLQGGAASLMNTKNIKPGKLPDMDEKISSEEVESLRKQDVRASIGSRYLKGDN